MSDLEEVVNKEGFIISLQRLFSCINPTYRLRNAATYFFIKLGKLKNYFYNN